jgi:hypothetical protein
MYKTEQNKNTMHIFEIQSNKKILKQEYLGIYRRIGLKI